MLLQSMNNLFEQVAHKNRDLKEVNNDLEEIVKKFNLEDRVTLLGFVEDMEYVYRKASIYVLSSIREGFPGGLCEAMGYGCTSIAFNCPTGPKEIIDNDKNGILVEANNINELSNQIQILIDDDEKRYSLSIEAQKITSWLEMKAISEQWIDLMTESVSKYKRGKNV